MFQRGNTARRALLLPARALPPGFEARNFGLFRRRTSGILDAVEADRRKARSLTVAIRRWLGIALLSWAAIACSRSSGTVAALEDTPTAKPTTTTTTTTSAPEPDDAAVPPPPPSASADAPDPPKPPPVPFLAVIDPIVPPGAYAKPKSTAPSYLPAGFDPLKPSLPVESVVKTTSGLEIRTFMTGFASTITHAIAAVQSGKLLAFFDDADRYGIDEKHGLVALRHRRKDESGARVAVTEIVDPISGVRTPLPDMTCTRSDFTWIAGERLVSYGFEPADHVKRMVPDVRVCVFDAVGKLLGQVRVDHVLQHAASIEYVELRAGVLPHDPDVVWVVTEYEVGKMWIGLADLRDRTLRRVARIPGVGATIASNVEVDLAALSIKAAEVRYRIKSPEGWWWKWQTKPLFPKT